MYRTTAVVALLVSSATAATISGWAPATADATTSVVPARTAQTAQAAPAAPAAQAAQAAAATLVTVDRARAAGVRGRLNDTYGAVPVDYNRDGRQDVWVGYHEDGAALFRNRGNGTYTRVARRAWPTGNRRNRHVDRHDCAWADVDRNGLQDAYCSTGRMLNNVVKYRRDNELWLQGPRGRFREVGTAWGVGDLCGRGRDVEFLNVNGDRFPDLFVGNQEPRDERGDPCDRPRNRLPNEASKVFINVRGKGFRQSRTVWHFGAGPGGRCAVALDFNRDGLDDLLACGDRNERPRLYRNRGGRRFVDVTARQQLTPVNDAVVADIDGDGDRDVVTATGTGFAYHPFDGGAFRAPVRIGAPPRGVGGSVAVGDVDGDGDRDVYGLAWSRSQGNPDDQVWINTQMTFSPISVPSARGSGDEAVALTPGRTGKTWFLVTNGHVFGRNAATFVPGRTQLIGVRRR
jgi:FG-GAP-like repeat